MTALWNKASFRENVLVAAAFFVAVQLLYGRTVGAGFVTDFTGLQNRLEGASFWGFLDCFGFPALHQVTNFFLYFFYHFFGQNGLPWHLIFTSLHVLNGVLGYRFAKKIFRQNGIGQAGLAAFASSLLFLFSPYAAEVVVWKSCFNYLFCTACVLGSLLLLLRFFENRDERAETREQKTENRERRRESGDGGKRFFQNESLQSLFSALCSPLSRLWSLFSALCSPLSKKQGLRWWSLAVFAVGLFTFELALVVPLMAGVLFFTAPKDGAQRRQMGFLAAGYLALLALYFTLNKMLFGGWVGHYGEATHLKFDPAQIGANLLKYFSKYLTLWREWPHALKQAWMGICESETVAYGALAMGALVVLAGLVFLKKMPGMLRAAWLCWLLFFIALLPAANLYAPWVLRGENDRYGYLASVFFFPGLVALLHYLPKYLRWPLIVATIGTSVFYTNIYVRIWQQSTAVVNGLLDDFRWEGAPEIYVLAMPENFRGIPMFKDFSRQDLALHDALKYGRGKRVKGKLFQVAQFNMATPADGVRVASDSLGHFHVQFNQWGNWWWRNGIGTGGYETDKYTFRPKGNGSEVWVKNPAAGAVFIFANGGRWGEVQLQLGKIQNLN